MSTVIVVGAGLAGMATSARLAKAGYQVTLIEQSAELGGDLAFLTDSGFRWDRHPATFTLPAPIRDLFRKSGRPLEREVTLQELPVIREHRFDDGTRVVLPATGRAAQQAAIDDGLGAGLGQRWLDWTEGFSATWELLRKDYLERLYSPTVASKELKKLLADRASLHRATRSALRDKRLRTMALYHAQFAGHDPRNVPWWWGMLDYLEQNFGAWQVEGGMGELAAALQSRLETRRVTVLRHTEVLDVKPGEGVVTSMGLITADNVVIAADPRRFPSVARSVERTMPAIPATVVHVGVDAEAPELPHEIVFHGDPVLTVTPGQPGPDGGRSWSIFARGRIGEDMVIALARHKIDLREHVVTRLDLSPRHQVEVNHGSSYGVLWQGRATSKDRPGTISPFPQTYAVGAHTAIAALPSFVALTSSLAVQALGQPD